MSLNPILLNKWFKDLLAIEKAVAEVSRKFISPDLTDLNDILSTLGEAAAVDRAYIIRFQKNLTKEEYIHKWYNPDVMSLSQDRGLHGSLRSWLIKRFIRGEDVMISDIESLPREFAAEKKILKANHIRSLLAVPIYSTTKSLMGCIVFDHIRESREWLWEEVRSFRIIAEMLSIYWERRQAIEALKKSEEKYRALYAKSKKDEEVYISEKKRLEAQLIRAQKMEAIGTLVGGIAHDFNNNLQAIFGCAEIMRLTKDKGHLDMDKIETIEKSARRASDLSKRLLVFISEMESQFDLVDLNREVRQVSKILEHTIPKMISIELELEENNKKIKAYPGQLEQIIMNLGINARDAMPEGGRLIFKTESVILNEDYCSTHPGSRAGEYILLTVSDTGCGMNKTILKHIFDPFFTTKKKGEGTGLGLAVVYGIVKDHGGHITCSSKPNEETSFKIYFPVAEKIATIEKAEGGKCASDDGGDETILLIDDEETVRKIGKETLAEFGYHVMTASDCESALDIFRKNRECIDLVILDLIMPGRGGKKMMQDLLEIDPDARIIIASGYIAKNVSNEVRQYGAKDFIGKPYDMRKMLNVIRNVLGREVRANRIRQ